MAEKENMMPEEAMEEDIEIITLEFDDDTKVDCEIMGIFECEDKDYIALLPEDGTDDVYIYAYQEYDDGTYELSDIEDDALFEKVVKEFDAIMEEEE